MKEIIDLDSGSAVTTFSFVKIPRDNPQEELGMVDLENYLSQGIWRLFDGCRANGAERLGVDEADLLLTDARVMGIKIDGHQIINPQGFTGKVLEILLAITMVRRDKFVENAELLEGGSVRAYLIAKELNFDNAVYVEVNNETTTIFSIDPSGVSYMSNFSWGGKNVTDSIEETLGVLPSAADGIYIRHAGGVVSDHVKKQLDKIFYEALGDFVNGVTMGIKNSLGARKGKPPIVYLRTFFPIPDDLHRKRFPFGDKRVRFLPPIGEANLRVFVDDEVHDIYRELNQLARRRIKWLMPTT